VEEEEICYDEDGVTEIECVDPNYNPRFDIWTNNPTTTDVTSLYDAIQKSEALL
jgi:hypothetical protein